MTAAVTDARTCLRWLGRDDPDMAEAREGRVASLPGGGDACAGVTVLFRDREEGAGKILFQFPMTAVATTPSRPMIATMICIETELSRLLSGSAIIHAFTQHGSRVGILRILIPRLIVP